MGKFNINFSDILLVRIKTVIRNVLSSTLTPDQLWRTVLACAAIAACVIGIFAYVNYRWALREERVPPSHEADRALISIAEMQEIILLYEQKGQRFNELKRKAPLAPDLGRRAGTGLTPSPEEISDQPQVEEASVVAP